MVAIKILGVLYLFLSVIVFIGTKRDFDEIYEIKIDPDIDYDCKESIQYRFNIFNYIFFPSLIMYGITRLVVIIYDFIDDRIS